MGKGTAGRPGKYETHVEPRLEDIRQWAKAGSTNCEIACALDLHISTFQGYLAKYPDLKEAVRQGRMTGVPEVRRALLDRALGCEITETETIMARDADGKLKPTSTKVTKKRLAPDISAIQLYLRNASEEWRDTDAATQAVKEAEAELKRVMAEMQGF